MHYLLTHTWMESKLKFRNPQNIELHSITALPHSPKEPK